MSNRTFGIQRFTVLYVILFFEHIYREMPKSKLPQNLNFWAFRFRHVPGYMCVVDFSGVIFTVRGANFFRIHHSFAQIEYKICFLFIFSRWPIPFARVIWKVEVANFLPRREINFLFWELSLDCWSYLVSEMLFYNWKIFHH